MSENEGNKMPAPTADGAKPKRDRKVRAIFLVLPPEAQVGELVRIMPCERKKDARKALETAGIDVTNHADGVRLLRGEYMPLKINRQVVFKF